jgi:hypothetical protein
MNPANVVRLQTQLGISKLPLKKISLLNGIASFVKSADSGRRLMTTSSQTLRMDFAERKGRHSVIYCKAHGLIPPGIEDLY